MLFVLLETFFNVTGLKIQQFSYQEMNVNISPANVLVSFY